MHCTCSLITGCQAVHAGQSAVVPDCQVWRVQCGRLWLRFAGSGHRQLAHGRQVGVDSTAVRHSVMFCFAPRALFFSINWDIALPYQIKAKHAVSGEYSLLLAFNGASAVYTHEESGLNSVPPAGENVLVVG